MKRLVALLLTVSLLMGMGALALAEEKRVLTVASWDTATGAYMAATEAAFEASHPDVDLQYIDVASQEYNMKATAMLAGGDTTDVFDVKELSDLQNWIAQGFVENLEPYVAESAYDLSPYLGFENYYRGGADNALYGLPYRSDYWVLFYNKTLFDAAGVAYPTNDMTWEQYADLAKQMTSGEGIDTIYGTHYHTWLSAVANWPVVDGVYTLADGDYEPLKYFYALYQDLEDAGATQPFTELSAAGLHYSAAFYQGNVAMLPMGYWFVATLISEKDKGTFDFDWSFVAVPHKEEVPAGASFGSPTATAININSDDKDLAWEYISWRCGEEGALAHAEVGTRPAFVSDAVAAKLSEAPGFPTDDGAKAALIPTTMGIEWPTGDKVPAIKTIVNEEHSLIMVRDVSIEDGIASMTERVAEVLAAE